MRNVVVVGAGGMGRAWMDAIARRADTRVSAVVDVAPAAARGAVEERGWDIPTMQTVDEALALVEADLLLNVTVPEAHLAVSSAALRAGVWPTTLTSAKAALATVFRGMSSLPGRFWAKIH